MPVSHVGVQRAAEQCWSGDHILGIRKRSDRARGGAARCSSPQSSVLLCIGDIGGFQWCSDLTSAPSSWALPVLLYSLVVQRSGFGLVASAARAATLSCFPARHRGHEKRGGLQEPPRRRPRHEEPVKSPTKRDFTNGSLTDLHPKASRAQALRA
jgi:hypothetical protein